MKQKLIILLVLLPLFSVKAQLADGNIAGLVLDRKTNLPLVGANIVVTDTPKGAASDADGNYFIADLPPGTYKLAVYYLGYTTILKSNVIVNSGKTTRIDFELDSEIMESDAVEVTASYFEKPREAVVSNRTMDYEEIRRSPGSAMDIQRVVQALPSVVSGSDQMNEIIIRGGYPGENLFMMDEIEIPNPNHFGEQGTGGGPINMINTLMVRKVDFYAGAFPVKYGDKASSVMDISLREGNRNRLAGQFEMGMAGIGGLIEGPVSDKGSYIISGRKSYLDLISEGIGLTAVPNYFNLQGKISYDFTPSQRLTFNAIYGQDEINIEDEGEGGYSRGAENVDTNGDQYAAGATLRSIWNPDFVSKLTFSSVYSRWYVDVYRTPGRDTYFENISSEWEHTLKGDFIYQISNSAEINWGLQGRIINFDYDIRQDSDTTFVYDSTGAAIGIVPELTYPAWQEVRKVRSNKAAAYVQFSADLLKRLKFTTGIRFNYFEYNNSQVWSPRMGLSYYISPKTTINLALGRHYQSPANVDFTLNVKNKNLENKYTDQIVLGFEKIFRDDIKFTLETYYKAYHKLPVLRRDTTPELNDYYQNEMLSVGEGHATGVEVFLQKKLTNGFSAIISYAHSIAEYKDLRNNTYYPGDYDYQNVLTLIGGYKISYQNSGWYKNWKKSWLYWAASFFLPLADEVEWSAKFRYLGGRPYTRPVYVPEWQRWLDREQPEWNTDRLPAYARLDIRLDRRFYFNKWSLVTFFDFSNVLGRENIWQYQYNDDGSVEKILQFQTLPLGGVIVEF